jgi:hypothetical protein
MDCSPRARGQGGLHGHKSGPVDPARFIARDPKEVVEQFLPIDKRYANVVQLQTELCRCKTRTTSVHSSGVPRVGPAGLPRLVGVAHPAAAGPATMIGQQINRVFQCLGVAHDFSHKVELMM